jgi:amidase
MSGLSCDNRHNPVDPIPTASKAVRMSNLDLLFEQTAVEWLNELRRGSISARELAAAALDALDARNPQLNAVVTVHHEATLEAASAADAARSRGESLGPLHGLPVVHKDLFETRGVRTTYGSPLFRDHIPSFDALIVERQKLAGAISIGKSNTPEFGAGSQTFNTVFGTTRNPYDPNRTCGGSSGGAAAAVAAGMALLADGSDFGASLRNPASFCNLVGLRPSAGRVPMWPDPSGWFEMHVGGPIARTVADAALFMSVVSGPDDRDPRSRSEPGSLFRTSLDRDFSGVPIAWGFDGWPFPFEPCVIDALLPLRRLFESDLRCRVSPAVPDLRDADEIFVAFRAWRLELGLGALLDENPDQFKRTLKDNILAGRALSAAQLGQAELKRTRLYHRMRAFLDRHSYLVMPTCQTPPFSIDEEYPRVIAGEEQSSYIDWMRSCSWISATGCPAVSIPGGFTPDGLPVGIQIVGRWGDDLGVLQLAHALEQATGLHRRRPK